jgi:hypothetical protein
VADVSKSKLWAVLVLALWRRGLTLGVDGRQEAAIRCIRAQTWF